MCNFPYGPLLRLGGLSAMAGIRHQPDPMPTAVGIAIALI